MFLGISWYLGRIIWLLPIVTNIWILASLATTYSISVALNHTVDDIPNISDTGIIVPERGIFSFCIVVSSILLESNAEMRFLFVDKIFQMKKAPVRWRRINFAGLCVGLMSAFGLVLVGCFQVDVYRSPHYLGSFLCFVVATGYLWLQTILTWKMRNLTERYADAEIKITIRSSIWIWQIINTALATIFLLLFTVSKSTFKIQETLEIGSKFDTLRDVFLVSTSTEWLLTFSVMFFLLSFIPAFRHLKEIRIKTMFDFEKSVCNSIEISSHNIGNRDSNTGLKF